MSVDKIELIWLMAVGFVVAALFKLEDTLESVANKEMSLKKALFILCINSLIGAFVVVTVFYLLETYVQDLHTIAKVGIAGGFGAMGKDSIKLMHKYTAKKVDK